MTDRCYQHRYYPCCFIYNEASVPPVDFMEKFVTISSEVYNPGRHYVNSKGIIVIIMVISQHCLRSIMNPTGQLVSGRRSNTCRMNDLSPSVFPISQVDTIDLQGAQHSSIQTVASQCFLIIQRKKYC